MNDLMKLVDEKVKAYVPEDQEDPEAEFTGTEMITTSEILFRFANGGDLVLFWTGIIASIGFGSAMPGFSLFFGEMVDDMSEGTQGEGDMTGLKKTALYMCYFAVFVWVVSWI